MESQKYECRRVFKEIPLNNLEKYVEIPEHAKNKKDCIEKLAKAIYEKLDILRSVYEDILNPDIGDLAISHEIRGTNINIQTLWKVYKKLLKCQRMYELATVLNDEKLYIEFIKITNESIEDFIENASHILKQKIEFWDREVEYRRPREYLG